MKYISAVLALAATALAVPAEPAQVFERGACTAPQYACATNPTTGGPGWQVCNTSGNWVYGGDCPPNTVCKFLATNGSPYCVPPGTVL